MTGGMVDTCVISSNSIIAVAYGAGGGVYMTGGRLRNCLVSGNSHSLTPGGVYCAGGAVESCTIAGNSCPAVGGVGGLLCGGGAAILNSIVYSNAASGGLANCSNSGSGWSYTNCCTTPTNGLLGSGNIDRDPSFANAAAGNFRLTTGSPCVNAGSSQLSWMTGALDVGGNPRIMQGQVDIGAYETLAPRGSVLRVH